MSNLPSVRNNQREVHYAGDDSAIRSADRFLEGFTEEAGAHRPGRGRPGARRAGRARSPSTPSRLSRGEVLGLLQDREASPPPRSPALVTQAQGARALAIDRAARQPLERRVEQEPMPSLPWRCGTCRPGPGTLYPGRPAPRAGRAPRPATPGRRPRRRPAGWGGAPAPASAFQPQAVRVGARRTRAPGSPGRVGGEQLRPDHLADGRIDLVGARGLAVPQLVQSRLRLDAHGDAAAGTTTGGSPGSSRRNTGASSASLSTRSGWRAA